jgi:molecular chaperone HscA
MAKIAINIATGSLQQDEVIVGIDLGTTNSVVAIIHPESKLPVALKEHNSTSLVPSIIHFDSNGGLVVGNAAKQFLISDPGRTIFSIKRLLGKSYNEVANNTILGYKIIDSDEKLVQIQVGEKCYSAIELSAFILKELKNQAEHILKTPVTKAVITVPAYFNDIQRQATRDAGKLAGLDVLRIINEPTAASLAYGHGLNKAEGITIAVYDLGGGTFDVSILNIRNGIFEVLATNGNTHLGGDDFDAAIVTHWLQQYEFGGNHNSLKQQLRLYAEEAKRHLSTNEAYEVIFNEKTIALAKPTFEALILPILEKTITCCINALKDSGLAKTEVKEVIMVGGSTRTPLVKKLVGDFFGVKVNTTVNPDEVVALGAAVQADVLAGNTKNMLLLDVTPLSLGLETMGGLMDVLLPRNSKIPTSASRQYTTYKDGQSGIKIAVYQGERDMVINNRKLAEFILSGIPAMPAGLPKIDVKFLINADGILVITAKELRSGVQQVVSVKPQQALTDESVEQMLLDSIKYAEEDIAMRALTGAKTDAEQLLQTTEKFIQKNISSLSKPEIADTSLAMQALQLALDMNDKDLIRTKTQQLNKISQPYAERIMNVAIGKSMKGKSI